MRSAGQVAGCNRVCAADRMAPMSGTLGKSFIRLDDRLERTSLLVSRVATPTSVSSLPRATPRDFPCAFDKLDDRLGCTVKL